MRQRWVLLVAGIAWAVCMAAAWWSFSVRAEAGSPVQQAVSGTGFTYQGQLLLSGGLVDDNCDMVFRAFNQESGGTQVGSDIAQVVTVSKGLFTAILDWGPAVFTGEARWLEIQVRCPAGSGAYWILNPRQPLTPTPYALHALNADFANRIVVAKTGGDFNSIAAALASITDNNAANRYLVWVAPGFYDEQVTMKPYVDLQGAGTELTYIQTAGSGDINAATVTGASSATLSRLSVGNSGGSDYAVGIYANGVGFKVEDVSVSVTSGAVSSYGIRHQGVDMRLRGLEIEVNGDTSVGIYQDSPGGVRLEESKVRAAGGTNAWGLRHVLTNGGGFTVMRSEIEAVGVNAYGVASGTAYELKLTDSEVKAVSSALPGAGISYAVTGNSIDYVTVLRSTLSAWNGNNNRGLSLQGNPAFADGETILRESTITVGDGGTAYGILLVDVPNAIVDGSDVRLQNGTDNRGVQVQDGHLALRNSAITVQNGSNIDYGVLSLANTAPFTATIEQVTIVSDDNTILMGGSAVPTVRVGGTRLDGGNVVVNSGGLTCAAVWDENYTFYANTCP